MTKLKKEVARKKAIYILPRKKDNYVIFFQNQCELELDYYTVICTRDIQRYMSVNFKKKKLIIKYFINTQNMDISKILNNITTSNCGQKINEEYRIDNIDNIFNYLEEEYKIELLDPITNYQKNDKLYCCNKIHRTNKELLNHVKSCDVMKYTLWYEDIPKQTKQKKEKINVTINNNVNITNNTQINYVGFRHTGTELLNLLTDNQKQNLLYSQKKINDLVKIQWEHPNLRNIRIRNRSIYNSCEIFDQNEGDFKDCRTREAMEYFVLDRLDDLDMIAQETKDPDLIERMDRYDSNIRKNEKNMNREMQNTVLQYINEKTV